MEIDTPNVNDNRRYEYSQCRQQSRQEYPHIIDMIKPGSKVIDLGCGNGSLLKQLKEKKQIEEWGIELVSSGVDACREKGLNVCQGQIDIPIKDIHDQSFDYAVCNVTIQMVMYPEILLCEMKRIAKYQIVSFPNFGFWKNRLDLLLHGRMPQPMLFGYQWYNTGHIHQLSIKDFEDFLSQHKFSVQDKFYFMRRRFTYLNLSPNLFATTAIYLLKKR